MEAATGAGTAGAAATGRSVGGDGGQTAGGRGRIFPKGGEAIGESIGVFDDSAAPTTGDLCQLDRASIASQRLASRLVAAQRGGSRWFGRFAKGTLRASVGGMRSPSFPRIRRSLTLLLALLVRVELSFEWPGRRRIEPGRERAPAGSTATPERADAVARADAWAVLGSKQGGRSRREALARRGALA